MPKLTDEQLKSLEAEIKDNFEAKKVMQLLMQEDDRKTPILDDVGNDRFEFINNVVTSAHEDDVKKATASTQINSETTITEEKIKEEVVFTQVVGQL